MNTGKLAGMILLGAAVAVIGLSAFTVNEREMAIKLQLGEVVEADYNPGLHFKWPLVQNIRKFPRRILTISDRPERIFTAENEAVQVDFFVKWRIVDPVRFYTSTGGSLDVANGRLSEIIKNAVVTEFGKRSVSDAISLERQELMRDMLNLAAPTADDLGVSLVDFRTKQVEVMDDVRNSVYQPMAAERACTATDRRFNGRRDTSERGGRA